MRKRALLTVIFFLSAGTSAHAACEVGRAMAAASQQAIDQKTALAQADADRVLAQIKSAPQQQGGDGQSGGQTCLERIQNIGITASAGLPTIEAVAKAIRQSAEGKACEVAAGQIGRGLGTVNGAISRTGINQVPGVGVSVGTNGQGGVATTTQDTSGQTAGSIWSRVQSIFR